MVPNEAILESRVNPFLMMDCAYEDFPLVMDIARWVDGFLGLLTTLVSGFRPPWLFLKTIYLPKLGFPNVVTQI